VTALQHKALQRQILAGPVPCAGALWTSFNDSLIVALSVLAAHRVGLRCQKQKKKFAGMRFHYARAPPWVGSRSPDGWDQIPRWAGGWACTSHPGVLGSIPKREEPGKTGAPCVKVPGSSRVPAPPWVGSRSPDGWDQIPRWAGGWACTRFPNERNQGKQAHPVLKYRVPHGSHPREQLCNRSCSNKTHTNSFVKLLEHALLSHNLPLPRVR
jgi:hypothetical protein